MPYLHVEPVKATLRPATAADASRVASLLIDTRLAFMPYAPAAHTETEVRDWVASLLVPTGGVTVAIVDGRVMGTMATERIGEVSWITQMAVDPSLVGQGLGSALMTHAMRTLAPRLRLYTFQANVGARRFYERHGFVATGQIKPLSDTLWEEEMTQINNPRRA
jgi:ribosomal protein S18 acetylase RimI-like enzyme